MDLAEIKAKLAAITPGPWRPEMWMEDWISARVFDPNGSRVCVVSNLREEGPANQELIAAAPEDMRKLVAEVERLELEVDAARAGRDALAEEVERLTEQRDATDRVLAQERKLCEERHGKVIDELRALLRESTQ